MIVGFPQRIMNGNVKLSTSVAALRSSAVSLIALLVDLLINSPFVSKKFRSNQRSDERDLGFGFRVLEEDRILRMEPMDHIMLFTKYPIPGYAKTRMIGLLGKEGAAMLSKELSEHIVRVLRASSKARSARGDKTFIRLLYAGNCSLDSVTEWLGTQNDEVVEPQSDGDLGKRLSTSFIDSFERMNAKKVLVVGSDIPGISEDIIQEAFQFLDDVDVVVGPSFDGGYYLMGMRQPTVQVFQNIPWSCDRTLEATKQRMSEAGLSCKELGPLADVDEPADFEEWGKVSGKDKDYYLSRSVA